MLDWLLTAFSYVVVFWAGFFFAAALAVARRADDEADRLYAQSAGPASPGASL